MAIRGSVNMVNFMITKSSKSANDYIIGISQYSELVLKNSNIVYSYIYEKFFYLKKESKLVIENCKMEYNTLKEDGQLIYGDKNSHLIIAHCIISKNFYSRTTKNKALCMIYSLGNVDIYECEFKRHRFKRNEMHLISFQVSFHCLYFNFIL